MEGVLNKSSLQVWSNKYKCFKLQHTLTFDFDLFSLLVFVRNNNKLLILFTIRFLLGMSFIVLLLLLLFLLHILDNQIL